MTLQDLIRSWVDIRSPWELRHVARNLALDCEGIDIDHPDLESCGGRLKAKALAILNELIPYYAGRLTPAVPPEIDEEEWANAWGDTGGALEGLAGKTRHRLGPQASSDPQEDRRQGDVKVDLVRYVSCRNIYQYWRGGLSADLAEAVRGDIEAFFEKDEEMKRHGNRCSPLTVPDAELGAPGRPVWVVEHAEAAHRREEIKGEPSAEKALAVAQRMALPGFVSADQRSRAVGIVALSYDLNPRALRAPTALDGMQPYFFPGYRAEDHGRVASLDPAFSVPWARTEENSGMREWVHDNRPAAEVAPGLELVGWFSN